MNEQRGAGKAVIDAIAQTMEANTSRKVFGDAVTVGDVTVIPAARVSGRGGGGGGGPTGNGQSAEAKATGEGSGGGMAQTANPIGAFVVKDDQVSWRPAVDVNKVVMGAQIVAIVALLTVRELIRHRRPY